jgi:hypothetical protein
VGLATSAIASFLVGGHLIFRARRRSPHDAVHPG